MYQVYAYREDEKELLASFKYEHDAEAYADACENTILRAGGANVFYLVEKGE